MADWSESRIAEYHAILASVEGGDIPEAIMRIPSIDLEVPVFAGTEERNLTRGAGRIEGTPPAEAGGNTGIAAHRDGYFRSLKDVAIGDRIEMETLQGVHRYRVAELFVVEPHDISVLDATESSALTLVTCYPFYFVGSAPQRFIVRAHRL
jgi:sortase A